MTNQQKRHKKESQGYKIIGNLGYRNGVQCIVSYTLKNPSGCTILKATSLTKLFKN